MTRPSAHSRVSTCATLRLAPISTSGNTPFLFAPKLHNAVGGSTNLLWVLNPYIFVK